MRDCVVVFCILAALGCRGAEVAGGDLHPQPDGLRVVQPWPDSYELPIVPLTDDTCFVVDTLAVSELQFSEANIDLLKAKPGEILVSLTRGPEVAADWMDVAFTVVGGEATEVRVRGGWSRDVAPDSGRYVDMSGWVLRAAGSGDDEDEQRFVVVVFMEQGLDARGVEPLAAQFQVHVSGDLWREACASVLAGVSEERGRRLANSGRQPRSSGDVDRLGRRDGVWLTYDDRGLVRTRCGYIRGYRSGEWKSVLSTGEIVCSGSFAHGVRDGRWREVRGRDGTQLVMEGAYLLGRRSGSWRANFVGGGCYSEGFYIAGQKEGRWTVYWPDGAPRIVGQYSKGNPTGLWMYWDEHGGMTEKVIRVEEWLR